MSEEKPLWNGTPSQVVNLPAFIIWGLFSWLIIPIFVIVWLWLVTRCTRYELTTQRLKTRHGVLNKQMDELELYRVRDYKFDQPIFLRLFGLGNITLHTSDKSDAVVTIRAIPNGEQLHDQLRSAVEACRVQKRVREVDFE